MYPMMPPRASVHATGRTVRSLSLWGAGVGVGLLALLAFVAVSTYVLFTRGEQLSGPSDGSMFHGGEVFFAWVVGNLAAGLGIIMLALAALMLDAIVVVKLIGLRGHVPTEAIRPLTMAMVAATGVVSTPVGVVLMVIPNIAFGPGELTNTLLIMLIVLMFLVPLGGRIAQLLCAKRLPARLGTHPGQRPPAPEPWVG